MTTPDVDLLTLTEAEASVRAAQLDFADTKAKHGAQVALTYFNRRVLRWAQQFTNPRLSRVMYVLGCAMDGETHGYAITVNGTVGAGTKGKRGKIVPGSLLDRYHKTYAKQGHTISYRQFHRYLAEAEELGIIERIQQGTQNRNEPHPGMMRPTFTHVNFWKVVQDGEVVPHDFYAELPALPEDSEPESKNGTEDGIELDTEDGTHPYESSSPNGSNNPTSKSKSKSERGKPLKEKKSRRPEDSSSSVVNSYWVKSDGSFTKTMDRAGKSIDKMTGTSLVKLTSDEGTRLWSMKLQNGSWDKSAQQNMMAGFLADVDHCPDKVADQLEFPFNRNAAEYRTTGNTSQRKTLMDRYKSAGKAEQSEIISQLQQLDKSAQWTSSEVDQFNQARSDYLDSWDSSGREEKLSELIRLRVLAEESIQAAYQARNTSEESQDAA